MYRVEGLEFGIEGLRGLGNYWSLALFRIFGYFQ